jgi:hypothetical protein
VRNFYSLWDTVKAFGGSAGIHKRLVEAKLANKNSMGADATQTKAAQEVMSKQVKAALLISGADMRKYGKLKD